MNQPNKDQIDRYIKGLASVQEKADMEMLFINGNDNEVLKQLLHKDWETGEAEINASDTNFKVILDRIHNAIYKTEYFSKRRPLQRFIGVYSKVAAVLLLPMLIAGALIFIFAGNRSGVNNENRVSAEIFAPLGSRVSFILPDGSVGMLNSGSKLTYSLPFIDDRKVSLIGESWFEVKSDEDHPFKIDIGKAVVRVLGTSFNVNAYPDENYMEVVLKQGKVEFQDKATKQTVAMQPSERLIYQDGKVSKTEADPEKYIGWTGGKLIFRGDPMAEVARRIERWYNVEVVLADKEIEKYSYRATFEDDNLEDVFRFLSMTSPITYNITSREMNPDGTYNKEKITIYLKK